MQYRVEELATSAGVSVDTIRYYQGRGLIHRPRREGRLAIYEEAHLERLRRIRALLDQGFSLAQIRRVLDGLSDSGESASEPLLGALIDEGVGERTFSRAELAREAGLPEALLRAVESAGLIEPMHVSGVARFVEADLEMARAALTILGAGFPLGELLQLAITHARNIRGVADSAIDLFDDHIRKADIDDVAITDAFRSLLPQVTRLVALHFQRTLVNRALERLGTKSEERDLALARAATDARRLEVEWR
jgi:DNA-binding transcriptional MerR regulator